MKMMRRVKKPELASGICTWNGKWRYESIDSAQMALKTARAAKKQKDRIGKKHIEKRAYSCPWCVGYHLTSKVV